MGLRFEETRPAWDLLEQRVEALAAAWSDRPEPPLDQFLPAHPPSLRRLVLVELIKIDLQERSARQRPIRSIEDYAREFPELASGGLPSDLLYEELHARKRAGDPAAVEDYRTRFPDQANELTRMMARDSSYRSTTLIAPRSTVGFLVGDTVDDFDLKAQLGEGAFAKVFLAYQRSMQRLVALKISDNRGAEPQTLAQLSHPHIVRVYDQRSMPEKNLRLLYMEFLAGGTLHDVIAQAKSIPLNERSGQTLLQVIDGMLERRGADPIDSSARRLLEQATWPQAVAWIGARLADALAAAHARGVQHRDIKPANVLLGADANPRLADFNVGFCSKLDGASPHLFFGGSLPYMSPEQMEAYNPAHERTAADLDARSDIYSLGVTLWELLTGSRPFADETVDGPWSAVMLSLTNRRKTGLSDSVRASLPPGCPEALVRALERCLAPDRDHRFPDAAALARVLDLVQYPRTLELLDPPKDSWRRWMRRYPLTSMLAAGLTPNILAGAFNYVYNYTEVIARPESPPPLPPAFERIQMAINGIAFPVAVLVFVLVARPVLRALRASERGGLTLPDSALADLRRRTLRLGHWGAWIGVGFWVGASIIYPVALRLAVPELQGRMFAELFMHFLASLTVCGLIAAAYPFFLGSKLGTGSYYPTFVRPGTTTPYDAADLAALERSLWPHLALAAAVPLVGVAALVLVGARNIWPMLTLCGAGLAGLALAVAIMRRIQRDIADLGPAVNPGDPRSDSVYSSRG